MCSETTAKKRAFPARWQPGRAASRKTQTVDRTAGSDYPIVDRVDPREPIAAAQSVIGSRGGEIFPDRLAGIVVGERRPSRHGRDSRLQRPESSKDLSGSRFPDSTDQPDRKSTRLNSSHLVISYAVFCLKK